MPLFGYPDKSPSGFQDRGHAGQVLAERLVQEHWSDPIVLGLARGGVPVAAEVARVLHAPLRVSVARKIGAPGQRELALGAVTSEGPPYYDQNLLRAFHLDENALAEDCERERAEARRRQQRYEQGSPPSLADRDVVLVDDGLATGATARAAVRMLRESAPRSITVAVPVGAPEAVLALGHEADAVVCVLQPSGFSAVGQWYRDFHPTEDAEILRILHDTNPS